MFKRFGSMLLLVVLLAAAVCPAYAVDEGELAGYSKANGYQYVQFGAYFTDADGGKQPILWRVLKAEGNEAYLLSEYILFGCPMHGDYDHYQGWESSDLYKYLNGTFKNDAFSPAEQAALCVNPEDGALVTLLSSDEMKNASFGFASNDDRLCESTAWAKILQNPPLWEIPKSNNKGNWKKLYIYSKGHKYSPWWSRTRSTDYKHEQRRVMDDGKIGRISVGNSDLGARPAITVDLSVLSILSGSGTFASPYVLAPDGEALLEEIPQPIAPEAAEEPDQGEESAPSAAPTNEEPIADAAPGAEEEPTMAEEPAVEETPAAEEQPAPAPAPKPVSSTSAMFAAAADPARIHEAFPELTVDGFLPDGEEEFVYKDENAGLWLYASQTLRIEINRRTGTNSKKQPLRWYEAQVYTKDTSELFDLFAFDEEHYTSYGDRYKALADKIAVQHKLVFAINSDFFIYRIERDREEKAKNKNNKYPIGVEIRHGNVLYDVPRKANSTVYPPLDVLAFYPDGTISMHQNATITAKELLKAGATNALSFGPILVENGQVSPRSKQFGNTPNPRTAFGMVEPGYYICVMVESRTKESKGESCVWLGEKMAELGCTSAMNLDGGATSTMLFMGQQINKSGNYGSITNRVQNELLGIGHSDSIH